MANLASSSANPSRPTEDVAHLIEGIGRDIRTIAVDEIELARGKLTDYMEQLVIKASVTLLGATVALIGLAMLCMVVVLVLAPVIPPFWVRLLLMAVIYIVVGGSATYIYMRRMAKSAEPDLSQPTAELAATVEAVERGLEY